MKIKKEHIWFGLAALVVVFFVMVAVSSIFFNNEDENLQGQASKIAVQGGADTKDDDQIEMIVPVKDKEKSDDQSDPMASTEEDLRDDDQIEMIVPVKDKEK